MTQFANKLQNHVLEFQKAFNHPHSDTPTPVGLERITNRQKWGSIEEAVELIHASSSNLDEFTEAVEVLKQGIDAAYKKQITKEFPKTKEERVIAQADAIADKLYFDFGDAVELGVDIEKVFDIVQQANMSKLFINEETGELYAQYTPEGKVVKSPRFTPPEERIKEEILRQLNK